MQCKQDVLAVLFATYLVCYMDRMVMASAIPFIAKDLSLTPLQSGAIMSAFFVGYVLLQIPTGLLVDRFGPRKLCVAPLGVGSQLRLTGAISSWSFRSSSDFS